MIRSLGAIRLTVSGLLVLTALFGLSSRVFAQGETTSAIIGEVDDASNAVPGAKVTITNRETGLRRSAMTDLRAGSISRNFSQASIL